MQSSQPPLHAEPAAAFDDEARKSPQLSGRTGFSATIDAIESEMTALLTRESASRRAYGDGAFTKRRGGENEAPDTDGVFVPLEDLDAAYYLTGHSRLGDITIVETGSGQLIDEAAILYANRQDEMVEQMLRDGIREDRLDANTRSAWLMLLDLYRVCGRREDFEELALAFAAKFEASPPGWQDFTPGAMPQESSDSRTPLVIFSGKLDAAITAHLNRIQDLAERHSALRLEFQRVTDVDPVGCGLLLRTLQRIRKPGFELITVGAPELADKIRSILQVGRRNETQAPWLLLLEVLRLLKRESEFEEVSMEYCVTFEVSPPPFEAAESGLVLARDDRPAPQGGTAPVIMPAVVEGKIGDLLAHITDQALLHQPLVIDCSRLVRVEFGAAGQLVDGLAPLCESGARFELHEVNHLVAALFRVIGLDNLVPMQMRKS